MDSRPIGIFDSGIGGLTVVKEIRKELPNESLIYIGDTARVPYGTRSRETINYFAKDLAYKLLANNVKALVVACNTISSTFLPTLKKLSTVPVIDVIGPTVQEAVKETKTGKIAVIGTTATIKSKAYELLAKMVAPQITVTSLHTPLFVPIIEEGLFDHAVVDLMIKSYLTPLKKDKFTDTLILGCTHYPLIKEKIQEFLGKRITVLDSAKPTALALKQLLFHHNLLSANPSTTQIYFTSDDPSKSATIAKEFLGEEVKIDKIDL